MAGLWRDPRAGAEIQLAEEKLLRRDGGFAHWDVIWVQGLLQMRRRKWQGRGRIPTVKRN